MEILKRLDHPNIVKLYEVFDERQKYYLICDLVIGGSLFGLMLEQQCFSEANAAGIMH